MADLLKDSLLSSPKVVAIAHDAVIKPMVKFEDKANLPGITLDFGQDLTSNSGRKAPQDKSVGTTEDELKPKMRKLLGEFAAGDKTGMAKRLFDAFLDSKPRTLMIFDDPDLRAAAARHENILAFMSAALSAPNSPQKAAAGKVRIHQALKAAGWDIAKLAAPADLGVPAFNNGSKGAETGDFDNGLGLMINGVQHAFAVATHYKFNNNAGTYIIGLRFLFYDVFGLDDQDLITFGADSDGFFHTKAGVGITAWWQLQHQFGHVPLVTRIILEQLLSAPLSEGESAIPASLLAACVLGLLLCPFVYLAIGALRAFEPAMFAITLPPLFVSIWYLGQRYLRRAANEPLRIRSVLFEAASWLVIGFFLLVVSNLNLMTPLERAGLFFCVHPVASAVLAPFTILRTTALKQRLSRLPPWLALTALAMYAGLAAVMAASYMLLPQRFIGS